MQVIVLHLRSCIASYLSSMSISILRVTGPNQVTSVYSKGACEVLNQKILHTLHCLDRELDTSCGLHQQGLLLWIFWAGSPAAAE